MFAMSMLPCYTYLPTEYNFQHFNHSINSYTNKATLKFYRFQSNGLNFIAYNVL